MKRNIVTTSALLAVLLALLAGEVRAVPGAVYAENCASCHGARRLGAIGPALIPESLGRNTVEVLTAAI